MLDKNCVARVRSSSGELFLQQDRARNSWRAKTRESRNLAYYYSHVTLARRPSLNNRT